MRAVRAFATAHNLPHARRAGRGALLGGSAINFTEKDVADIALQSEREGEERGRAEDEERGRAALAALRAELELLKKPGAGA